ncbi:MAG: hybrid sensor histidine kinase/response regulator [Stenomitos rutilans HA7619-LM2]|jgi:chemotaxis protein histidine kinase CheA/CheY-like chemotaxis protein|nr:hybrid sensor histidine kinase/response regulator [Stenomitos rutilans HA7619-LM2]
MSIPSTVQQEDYANFLTEASDLLQTIEQELFHLKQDHTPARVHSLMRAAHTLKGSAASVQLETVKSVAHVLEDVFRALYNPKVVIDAELEALLFQAYECLRLPLMAEFTGGSVDEAEILGRSATVLSALQTKLGDLFDQDTPIPTSVELGFDLVQSMFEGGVEQRLQALEQALTQPQLTTLAAQLQAEAEVFLGLAESLQLAGFGAIAQTTLAALAAHPNQIQQIAPLAIADFRQGQAAVLAGDRTQGGSPAIALQQLAQVRATVTAPTNVDRNSDGHYPEPHQPFNQPSHQAAHGYRTERSLTATPTLEKKPKTFFQRLKDFFSLEPIYCPDRPIPTPTSPIAPPTTPSLSSSSANDSLDAFFDRISTEPTPFTPPSTLQPDHPLSPSQSELPRPNLSAPDLALSDLPQPDLTLLDLSMPYPALPDLAPPNLAPPDRFNSEQSYPTPDTQHPTPDTRHPTPDSSPTPVVRVNLGQLERLDYLAGELLINQNQQTMQDDQFRLAVQELVLHLQKHKRTLSSLQSWSDLTLATNGSSPQPLLSDGMTDFDALEMDRYTDFHVLVQAALNDLVQLEIVGESLETQIRQARQARETQKRLLTSIQDDLTTARMQPLSETLNRLSRVLQQLATVHSKPVAMSLSGMSVLVDKAIAEKLYNPLLHLVRNAFDHGIEAPALRQASGKPETGQIHIHAYHQGNRTLIEIRDDGQGIDWQRVAEKAIAIGLVTPDVAADLSSAQLADFLFRSGFSTAAQVNDLSGRGVGLDMVRSEMQALKGTVNVSSTPGHGTTFTLSLPLSFSTTRLMICQQHGITYALPINVIQQVILSQPNQLMQTSGQQMVLHWQADDVEQMVPVHTLAQLLNIPRSKTLAEDSSQRTPIILLQGTEGLWGLRVDQVMGEQELVIRPLGTAIAPPPYVYGCSLLNDRQMALVIDPVILQAFHIAPLSALQPTKAPATLHSLLVTAPPSRTHILLIEDSLTVRHSLARTLQEQGYRVSQAGDGLEAFTFLQQDPDVHLIISDVEMPRMNGFEFLSQLRKTPTLQTIPVVMLTSRSGEKYRQFATDLGANAFVNKPFSAEALLPLLETLINPSTLVKS